MAETERLKVHLVKGENRAQTVVRGQIEVPYAKPDVDKILSNSAKTKVRKVSIVPDKVIIEGTLTLQVMYVAFKPDQSVHSMHGDVKFTTFVDVEGAEPGMEHFVEITVEDVRMTPAKRNPRKFDVTAVLGVFVKVTEVDELEILISTPPGNEALETEDITVEHLIGEKVIKQIIVSEQFDIPEEKPDIEKILDAKAEADITEKKVIANKVIIDGEVSLQVLYVAMEPRQSVHEVHHTIKFSSFVEIAEAQPGMNVQAYAVVEAISVEPVIDPKLTADIVVKLIIFVSETRLLEDVPTVLRDEEGFERKRLKVDREIGFGETQVVVKDTAAIPEAKPDIAKVLEAWVDSTEVTETNILDEKVLIRGRIDVEVIYVSTKPDQAVHGLSQRHNFRTFVVVPFAQPDMDVKVRVDPEFVSVEQVGIDIHKEVVLKVRANVTEMSQPTVYVPGIEPTVAPTVTPCPPTPYTVQKGDTLGKIAAANGVTVQMILEINPEITNPDVISVGQVIMIPCRAMG